jgi:hypothetical protein
MRLLGHDGVKEEREAHNEPLDSCLLAAWEHCRTMEYTHMREIIDDANVMLAKNVPSLVQLHRLVLETPPEAQSSRLGAFITAGYNMLPQHEIVYPYDTPELLSLGYRLFMKNLVIRGNVGILTGEEMVGNLIIEGSVGAHAGTKMIGTLTNNGSVGAFCASEMIGEFTNNTFADYAGLKFTGRITNNGQIDNHRFSFDAVGTQWLLSNTVEEDYCGLSYKQQHTGEHKADFLHDITNPSRLPYEKLFDLLSRRYRRYSR